MKVSLINKTKAELQEKNINIQDYCLYLHNTKMINDKEFLVIKQRLNQTPFIDIAMSLNVKHGRIRQIESTSSKKLTHPKCIKAFQNANNQPTKN